MNVMSSNGLIFSSSRAKRAVRQKKSPVVKRVKIEPLVNDRLAWVKVKQAGQDKTRKIQKRASLSAELRALDAGIAGYRRARLPTKSVAVPAQVSRTTPTIELDAR